MFEQFNLDNRKVTGESPRDLSDFSKIIIGEKFHVQQKTIKQSKKKLTSSPEMSFMENCEQPVMMI